MGWNKTDPDDHYDMIKSFIVSSGRPRIGYILDGVRGMGHGRKVALLMEMDREGHIKLHPDNASVEWID